MIEIPVPTVDEVLPLLPGAALAVGSAVAALRVRAAPLRALLVALAAVAPWWTTWSITHGGFSLTTRSSSERAALALALWALVHAVLPAAFSERSGRAVIAEHLLRVGLGIACVAVVLWTFLDPAHPYHVSWGSLVISGFVIATVLLPSDGAPLLGSFTTFTVASIGLTAAGLMLVGVSGAAALSQVVASTSIAAGLAGGVVLLMPKAQASTARVLLIGWLGAGLLAIADAQQTSDVALSASVLGLLAAGVMLPVVAVWIDRSRQRPWRRSCTALILAVLCAAGAVVLSTSGTTTEAPDLDDPYGGLESFK